MVDSNNNIHINDHGGNSNSQKNNRRKIMNKCDRVLIVSDI